MSLQSIEEEGKKADEIWESMYGEKNPPEDEKGKTDEKAPIKEPETPPKEPEPKKEEPPAKPPEEDWKHKYDVLKGKYDAEVPRLAFELAEMTKGMGNLSKEIEEIKKVKTETPPPEKPKEDSPALKRLKEEYPEIYEGTIALIDGVKEKFSRVDTIDEKIEKIEKEVVEVKEDNALTVRERYLAKLDDDDEVGNEWRRLNEDPEFIKFLEETEPYTGFKKKDLLMNSWNEMKPSSTLQFFKDFKARKPAQDKDTPKPDVKKEDVHPPRGQKGSGGDQKGAGDAVTMEQWEKFTQDVITGRWKGKEAEMEKEELRLLKGLGIKPRQP